MTVAKKAFHVALGAGGTAVDKAKELPERVVSLPGTVSSRVGDLPELVTSKVQKLKPQNVNVTINLGSFPKRAQDLIDRTRSLSGDAQKRATKAVKDFSKRGEKIVKDVQKSRAKSKKAPAKRKPTAPRAKAKPAAAPTNGAGVVTDATTPVTTPTLDVN